MNPMPDLIGNNTLPLHAAAHPYVSSPWEVRSEGRARGESS